MTYASPYKSATLTTRVINLNRLRWARAIWIAIVLVNTLYGVINLIAYTSGRLQPCSAEPCLGFQLSVHATEQYALSGVPFAVAALMRPVLETVLVMVYTGVGLLIFRRRSDSWMGLISSLTLCLHGFQLT